jgi:hypothetical protein
VTAERPDNEPPGRSWSLEFPSQETESDSRRDGDPWASTTPKETFPRLGDIPQSSRAGRINGAWGWAVLLVPVLLLGSFAFIPSSESTEEASSGDATAGIIFGIIVLLVWFVPYIAGAIAAFRGNRKGITWTFPVTCVFAFLILLLPLGGPAGVWIAGTYGFGLAGFSLHFAARRLTKTQGPSQVEPGMPFAS